ncbi:MAG: hypothetical protein ABFE07_20650 [Armatimonadia bacterium]
MRKSTTKVPDVKPFQCDFFPDNETGSEWMIGFDGEAGNVATLRGLLAGVEDDIALVNAEPTDEVRVEFLEGLDRDSGAILVKSSYPEATGILLGLILARLRARGGTFNRPSGWPSKPDWLIRAEMNAALAAEAGAGAAANGEPTSPGAATEAAS